MRTTTLSVVSLAAIAAFGLLALGSGKAGDSKTSSSAEAAASGSPSSGGGKQAVLATCNIKAVGKCTENYGMVPTMAADMCKSDEGTFSKGSTPCPTEGLVGTCEFKAKAEGEPGETSFYYTNSVGDPKGSCEALGAIWTSKAAAGAGSATPAASGAPAASAAPVSTGDKPAAPHAAPKAPAKKK